MGAVQSSGLGERQEKAEEVGRCMLAMFCTKYLSVYAEQLVQQLKSELESADSLLAGSTSQLILQPETRKRTVLPPVYEGWLTKLGAVRKSWKRRWFVISSDPACTISYYSNPRDRQPKGEMILQGYEVRPDCFKNEKNLCIELYHRTRRCLYVYADNHEDYKQWICIFEEVCRKARYQLHPDPLRAIAFNTAYKATRMMLENTMHREPEGSEAEALVDLVCERVDRIVLGDTFLEDNSRHNLAGKLSIFTNKSEPGAPLGDVVGLRILTATVCTRARVCVEFVVATAQSCVVPALQSLHERADFLRLNLKAELKLVWSEFIRIEGELNERIAEVRCNC